MSVIGVGDEEKLKRLAETVEREPASQPETLVVLGESAQKVLDSLHKDSDKSFDYAESLITKIRETCDTAMAVLKAKREDVKIANTAYVGALQKVSTLSEQAQKALGEVMINSERLGG